MSDLKIYQIPRAVLAKEPKPLAQIDLLEQLAERGFQSKELQDPAALSLIKGVADLVVGGLGYTARTNYGVVSVFDPQELAAYEELVEKYRVQGAERDEAVEAGGANPTKKDKKKKKKKKKKK